MPPNERVAADFAARWQGRGNEDQDTRTFWFQLLQDVLKVPDALNAVLSTLRQVFGESNDRIHVQAKVSEHAGRLVANLHKELAGCYRQSSMTCSRKPALQPNQVRVPCVV